MRKITIEPVLNGFIVQIGCQKVVRESIAELCSELRRYFEYPQSVEREYLDNAVNLPPEPQEPTRFDYQPGVQGGIDTSSYRL